MSKARHRALKEALRKVLEEVEPVLRGTSGRPLASEAEISEAVRASYDEIRALPSVAQARDILLGSSLSEDVRRNLLYEYPDDSGRDWGAVIQARVLRPFIEFVLIAGSDQFERVYGHFEDFLSSSIMEISDIAHLRNFESEVELIQLSESACIRKFSEPEHRDIVRTIFTMDPSAQIENRYLSKDQFGIELRDTIQKSLDREIPHKFAIDPNQVLWALRLFKSGRVYYNIVISYEHDWLYKTGPRRSSRSRGWAKRQPSWDRYVLGSAEVKEFLNLWDQVKKVDLAKEDLALKRFEAGLARRDPKESLIEFMIAFENLLGIGAQELKFRMATNLAWFLGKDYTERRQMYRTFNDGYDLRSDIVHGRKRFRKKKFEDPARLQALVKKLEGYLRTTILKILLDGKPDWEQIIFQG